MPSVTVFDTTGKETGALELRPEVFGAEVRVPLLHQAVVRELADRRVGTHDTKGRSEVSGGGKKPWRQKGTGRARQGSIRATQWKGGGKPFGPTPRSYDQALPRAVRWVAGGEHEPLHRRAHPDRTVALQLEPDVEPRARLGDALDRHEGGVPLLVCPEVAQHRPDLVRGRVDPGLALHLVLESHRTPPSLF